MSDDTHDKLIKACMEYIKWHERFEFRGSDEAGIKARFWLSEVRNEASTRRVEIQEKRQTRKESRKGMVGRPLKIHKG